MPFDVRGRERDVQLGDVAHALVKARGDGNCLFHAAGHALTIAGLIQPAQDGHALLRTQVVAYVALHAKATNALGYKLREGMGIAHNREDAVTALQGAAIDRRVEYLGGVGHWGDEACITAIERLYDVEAEVYDDQGRLEVEEIRWYTPSHAKATKLPLCVRLVGAAPVHYDLFVLHYDAQRDGGNLPVVAPRKGGEVAQSAKEPWAYHLNPRGLRLFCPAIGHRQLTYSRAVVDAIGKKVKVVERPVSLALGDHSNGIEGPPAPVVAVHVKNREAKGKRELGTRSFSAATDADELRAAVIEPLILPLVRVEGACINLLDLTSTDLIVDVERGKAPQPTHLHLRVYRRAFGRMGARVADGGLIAAVEIELAKLKPKAEELSEPDRTRYTLDPSAALGDRVTQLMTWQASPFQIVACSDAAFDHGRSAWTHAHVQSEWDINVTERLAQVPAIMLDDSPTALAGLGVDAAVDPPAKLRETFALPAPQEVALGQLLAAAGLGVIDTNANNYLVEVAPGEWYASTSWASMASLRLNAEDGRYYLHALYWSGSNRRAFVATAAELAHPNQRQQGLVVALIDRVLLALNPLRLRLQNEGGYAASNANAIATLRAKSVYDSMVYFNTQERAENTILDGFRDRYVAARDAGELLKLNAEARAALGTRGFNVDSLTLPPFLNTVPPAVYAGAAALCERALEAMYIALRGERAALVQKGLALDAEEVEGVKDFDLGGGKHLLSGNDWKRHVFRVPLKMSCAVTTGISSCAGGLTFTTEKVPEHVVLWHLDANLSIPLLTELERLWPKGKDKKEPPALRTVALITPTLWELNKYRPDNLYPPASLEACQSVFFARGSHWFAEQPVVAGCDLFGVDARKAGQIDLVLTYDIDKRTEPFSRWRGLEAGSEDTLPALTHFRGGLFGTYRYEKAAPKTPEELCTYIGRVTTPVVVDQALIKADKRQNANKSCRIPAMSAGVFEVIAKSATPLLEIERALASEKGELELAQHEVHRWTPGSRG